MPRLPDKLLVLHKQCDVEFTRASGPGGQHRNKAETAVRLTHRPTGIVTQGTERRSQHQNLRLALERLDEKLAQRRKRRKRRVPTRKSRRTRGKEIESKRRRGQMKKLRGKVAAD